MVLTPTDITKILTAAAPIVASVTSMNKKSENDKVDDKPVTKINITVNNNFYTDSEEAKQTAAKMEKEVVNSASQLAERRYFL